MQERLTHRSGSELNRMSSVSHGQYLLARVEASGHAIPRHALARPPGLNLLINHSVRLLRSSEEAWGNAQTLYASAVSRHAAAQQAAKAITRPAIGTDRKTIAIGAELRPADIAQNSGGR
jgi:hypothetical protein